ncbi:MAG: hypothetical protein ABWY25_06350 [Paenisporosarcina sp.]
MAEEVQVFYCPRSCHKGRTYSSLEAVIKHVALQHPDHDPKWWVTKKEDEINA